MAVDNVNVDKDYVLSCATLFSDLGFPKAAFIRMIGSEYASDIFELVSEERMVMTGLIFTFPRRNSWKRRVNQEAKQHFFHQLIREVVNYVRPYVSQCVELSYNGEIAYPDICDFVSRYQNKEISAETEEQIKRYHRNLGQYVVKTLERSVNKMPLSKAEVKRTYSLLGCYYSIIRDFESADIFLKRIAIMEDSVEEC